MAVPGLPPKAYYTRNGEHWEEGGGRGEACTLTSFQI